MWGRTISVWAGTAWLGLIPASVPAAFVYSGPQLLDPFGGPPASVDLDMDLQSDFEFLFSILGNDVLALGQFLVDIPSANSVLFQGGVPALLPLGTLIEELPTAPREWRGNTVPSGSLIGQWSFNFTSGAWSGWSPALPPGDRGYLGVRFQTGAGPRLGWVEIEFLGTGADAAPFIVGWGHDTDPVGALAAGVIPEPATGWLLLLGLAGLWSRRLRA